MIISFWTLLFLVVYCYLGYPWGIFFLGKVIPKHVDRRETLPALSIVLSVYNEENVIKLKIENILSLDYPKEKIEILIGSDGSTDKTNDIIASFKDSRIRLYRGRSRKGKTATINDLVAKANHPIIVFSDARQTFARDALKQLMANFYDPDVGCASGELIFSEKEGATSKGINLYWKYEKFIRHHESQVHSMLGATGAIYAIQKSLFVPVPEDVVLDDMYVPLKIINQGYRAVFDEHAKAYDEVAESPREEHRRKARTLYGNYQIFGILSGIFNPFKSPVAIQMFSHKLLRVLMPLVLVALFIVNLFLLGEPFYRFVFILQIIFYAMSVIGGLARYEKYGILGVVSKMCYVPYVFCLLNFSALVGLIRFAGKNQEVAWEKAKKE